jgi:hypothetical protein
MFDQRWLDAVVSIEVVPPTGEPDPIGTGFLLQTPKSHVLLVTAKHVLPLPLTESSPSIGYRVNVPSGKSVLILDKTLTDSGLGTWFTSKTADLACRYISWPEAAKIATIPVDRLLAQSQVEVGAPLMILGFPLGYRSTDHSNPIARRGMVARSDREGVIADAFVFPGNSGGPVVYAPALKVSGPLTSPLVNSEMVVGMVLSYIPFQDPAVSPRTKRLRVMFEENSGLAIILPSATIRDLVDSPDIQAMDSKIGQ